MTVTLHLRFPDEATCAAALEGMTDRGVTVDVIGKIVHILEPGEPPVTETLPGWHANVRGESAEDRECLAAYVVHPVTPVRVFA